MQNRARKSTTTILDDLRQRIGRGELAPGAPLRQDHIAERFGVSHVPVREALNHLVSEGLATSRLHCGTVVLALSEADALELAEYRGLLEAQLIRLAVPNLSRNDLARAEAIVADLDAATELDQIVERNAAFHATLYAKAERPFFMRAVEAARLNLGRYLRGTWLEPGGFARSQAEHRQLLTLCAAGDGDGASALVMAHLQTTGQLVASIIRAEEVRVA
jgi:DNA-binding GntR family transcriptional regulator